MGIVTRPIKPIGGAGTNEWVADTEIMANEENEDIVPIYTELNGKLNAANMDPNAALPGTMLAAAPNGVPQDRINNNTVNRDKLVDGEVIESKLATNSITLLKIEKAVHTNAGVINILGQDEDYDTTLPVASTLIIAVYYTANHRLTPILWQSGGTWRVKIFNHGNPVPDSIPAGELKVVYLSN